MTSIDLIESTMQTKIHDLDSAATISLTIAISVALIAAVMGITQLKSHPKIKYVVLGLGLFVPVLQVLQVQVFPYSHQSYKRMAITCTRILVDMDLGYKRQLLMRMDNIEQRSELLGSLNEQQAQCLEQGLDIQNGATTITAADFSPNGILSVASAYAEDFGKRPSWITTPQNKAGSQCFVGKATNSSLEAARSASYKNGIAAALRFYAKALPGNTEETQTQFKLGTLSRVLANSGSKVRDYYTYNVDQEWFEAFSLVCVANSRVRSAIEIYAADQNIDTPQPLITNIQMQAVEVDTYSMPQEVPNSSHPVAGDTSTHEP